MKVPDIMLRMSGFRHCAFFYVTVVKSVFQLENKIYKKLADMFHIIHDELVKYERLQSK